MLCTTCGKEFFEDWRKDPKSRKNPPMYCSRSCSCSKEQTDEMNQSRKRKLRKHPKRLCSSCGNPVKSKIATLCRSCFIKKKSDITILAMKSTISSFLLKEGLAQHKFQLIRAHAQRILNLSGREKKCEVCEYKLHVEVCHIKPISSFSEETLMGEVNSLDNLKYLCPNHHWELDNLGS